MLPVVLVPGLLCTAEVFAPQIPALWPHGPVTIASTHEGTTIAAMASAILVSAPPRFALAGISMGGYISLEIMRQAPERVEKLALLNTSARPDTPEQTSQRDALVQMAKAEVPEKFSEILAPVLSAILHPAHQNDPVLRDVFLRMALATGVDGFARQVAAIASRKGSLDLLPMFSIPTLVLVGDSDPLTPPALSCELVHFIPDARFVKIPECGHGSTLEQPAAVNRALTGWLA